MSLAIYTSAAWTANGGLQVADNATIEVQPSMYWSIKRLARPELLTLAAEMGYTDAQLDALFEIEVAE